MITKDRNYRSLDLPQPNEDGIIEGYAAVFDKETILYKFNDIEYKEKIDKDAFKNCIMNDVVLNVDHEGKPAARTKNNTLKLTIDEIGLKIWADLNGTEYSRNLHEEIKKGYFDKMSFAFRVNDEFYDYKTHTRTILSIEKLFDVSVVTFAAYEQTSLFARNKFESEDKNCKRELLLKKLQIEDMKQKLK